MANAKQELIKTVDKHEIICAYIEYKNKKITLKTNHTNCDFNQFLDELDFSYDDRYGTQEVYGVVWLTEQKWLERSEYDGAEWWSIKGYPPIPEECNK